MKITINTCKRQVKNLSCKVRNKHASHFWQEVNKIIVSTVKDRLKDNLKSYDNCYKIHYLLVVPVRPFGNGSN